MVLRPSGTPLPEGYFLGDELTGLRVASVRPMAGVRYHSFLNTHRDHKAPIAETKDAEGNRSADDHCDS